MSLRSRSAAVLFATAGVVWVLDRVSKVWVERSLAGRPPLTLIPGVLDLRFTTNSGGAFSLGQSASWVFAGASIVVAGTIAVTAFRHEHTLTAVALGLILGALSATSPTEWSADQGCRATSWTSSTSTSGRCSTSRTARSWSGRSSSRSPPSPPSAATRPPPMPVRSLSGEPGRLDTVLARLTGAPRADVQRAITAGRVLVDGQIRPKSFVLVGGERLEVELEIEAPLTAEGPPVPVRFEDGSLAVVAKPAGVVTHPTERRRTGTLVNRLLSMRMPLAPAGGPLRPGIVHRLDAGTSGLLVVAKTDEAYAELSAMFRRHDADRRYLALVRGRVEHEAFAVDAALGRRAARTVLDAERGRHAQTAFEVRERFDGATLLGAAPRTGRTHQIRAHLASIGHPILGDRAYGGMGDDARRVGLDRPFLHAWGIAFTHPLTGERIDIREPLPPDLERALELTRR